MSLQQSIFIQTIDILISVNIPTAVHIPAAVNILTIINILTSAKNSCSSLCFIRLQQTVSLKPYQQLNYGHSTEGKKDIDSKNTKIVESVL
jgi:hypothetical protein